MPEQRFVATLGQGPKEGSKQASYAVAVELLESGRFRVSIEGRERIVDACRVEPGTWSLLADGGGVARLVDVEGALPTLTVTHAGASIALQLVDARRAAAAQIASSAQRDSGPQAVRAPMPGKVVKVLVRTGDAVKSGQGVAIVEAMKMENELRAPRDGSVIELTAREGQAVEAGQTLATIG